MSVLRTLAVEPPFRRFSRRILGVLPISVHTRARWELTDRPQYLLGVLQAAKNAQRQGAPEICVAEFGVAGGRGLLALEQCAIDVARETGITIHVFGFDTGSGLPELCGDYRDHPDQWVPADYSMDVEALRRKLGPDTGLILGNVGETVPEFVAERQSCPIGFASFDMDLYSSTISALKLFSRSDRQMLRRTTVYFDNIDFDISHRFAGELLAIDQFNGQNDHVKIDRWRGIHNYCVFPDNPWVRRMYVAHDLEAIAKVQLERTPNQERCRL